MGKSRSAKEICAEDPGGISCKVARNREARAARERAEYGDVSASEPKETKPKEGSSPKPATDRARYLEEQIKKQGG